MATIYQISKNACDTIKSQSPFDTGNLRYNGINLQKTGKNEYTISIGAPDAPYAVYTNEVWVSPRWKGRKNPNEHWIDLAVQRVLGDILSSTGGALSLPIDGLKERWLNKSYWDSEEGQAKIKEYGIDDIYSIVG